MDMTQYMEMFIEESREHLQAINENLLSLEQSPGDLEIVNVIFRSAHTLKGMSATMGFEGMARLTHEMENGLDLMRNGKLAVTSEVMDVLFRCVDVLESQVSSIIETGSDSSVPFEDEVDAVKSIISGEPITQVQKKMPDAQNRAVIFNDYEQEILQQSVNSGFLPYQIRVRLEDTCLMRAARAYMVFNELESLGEIIKSEPSVQDLEDEKFDREFQVVFVSQVDLEKVKKTVLGVSEVAHADVSEIDLKAMVETQTAATEVAATVASATQPQKSAAVAEKSQTAGETKKLSSGKSVRVDIERLDTLMNLFSELVIDRTRLEQISKEASITELTETVEHMSRISGDLQNIVMTIRMVPVETVFNRFPRMVRDLARDLNKKVDFVIRGADTELDRTVIDEIGDPLVHMLRNALDHGLEGPEERISKGKPEIGTLELVAYHSGNHVFIEIIENGRGIDRDKILQKAVERGLVDSLNSESLTDEQVFDFMFRSGFSTAEKISDVSGRGVGLDVVKNKIESLGGKVVVRSTLGKGTTFMIQLPLTLSIIQAMLTQAGDETYAIPLTSIIETAIISHSDVKTVHKQNVIDFRGRVVPLVSIEEVFQVPRSENSDVQELNVVVVRKGDKMAALIVDSFIGQQEVVLKSLGKYLSGEVFAISGATILGDGQVALIMDCNALIP